MLDARLHERTLGWNGIAKSSSLSSWFMQSSVSVCQVQGTVQEGDSGDNNSFEHYPQISTHCLYFI